MKETVQPVVKKLVTATGAVDYNVLQNNGRIAHQEVDHVHFHMVSYHTLPYPWNMEKENMS